MMSPSSSSRRAALVALVLTAAAVACSDQAEEPGNSAPSITDQPLQGQLNGEPWSLVAGQATPGFEMGQISITLYADGAGADPCDPIAGDRPQVFFDIDARPADVVLGLSGQTVTFYTPPSDNVAVLSGRVVLEIVDESKVIGQLVARSGTDLVDGRFEVPRCAR